MILEQVHFVDVEETAVGRASRPGSKGAFAARQRAFEIERADHPVLR